jgi:hypothetical protein
VRPGSGAASFGSGGERSQRWAPSRFWSELEQGVMCRLVLSLKRRCEQWTKSRGKTSLQHFPLAARTRRACSSRPVLRFKGLGVRKGDLAGSASGSKNAHPESKS